MFKKDHQQKQLANHKILGYEWSSKNILNTRQKKKTNSLINKL